MRAAITPLGGISNDQLLWQDLGRSEGFNQGLLAGREQGLAEGYNDGFNQGYNQGYSAGSAEGNTAGYNEAIDEANAAIAKIQAQNAADQNQVAENYQAYAVECDQLRQALVNQAAQIRTLEEKLAQRGHAVLQQHAKIENQHEAYRQLKLERETLQEGCNKLKQRVQTLQHEKAMLNEAIENLTHANDVTQLKTQAQLDHYNKTLVFVNAIKGTVEFLIEKNSEIEHQISELFAGEYKKAVDFKTLTDEIKSPPHEDSDFKLLLPQTHNLTLRLLKKSSANSSPKDTRS